MFLYHWTYQENLENDISQVGLRLSPPKTVRLSPVGVPYKVVGRKIWLCDATHLRDFSEHLNRIRGRRPNVLLRVDINPVFALPFRPLAGAYFVRFRIPREFLIRQPLRICR